MSDKRRLIDLSRFRTPGSVVFSGRPKGTEIRKLLQIDAADEGADAFTVAIPKEIVSVNSSFFLGLFARSVRRFGREAFMAKYQFDCSPAAWGNVERGIEEALVRSNPLVAAAA
ncbi:MAG: hypothetical protein ABR526_08820 [Chthoniobacterales bacterium]